MVASPDDRDLSNKEREHTHTHTYSTEKKHDGQIKRQQKESQILHFNAMVQW